MINSVDASIVIRTKNEASFIKETLNRVLCQDFRGDYEVIIVDSGSTDSTIDIVKGYDVRLIHLHPKEFTYGRSLNAGASHARGEFVVNLSAHATPKDTAWLKNLIKGFEERNIVGVYGRQVSDGHLNPFEAFLNEVFFPKEKLDRHSGDCKNFKTMRFTNSNAAIRRSIWQEHKFNEEVMYGEDLLWQREVLRAGFSVAYQPDAVVNHTHEVSVAGVYRNSMNCAYNSFVMEDRRQCSALILLDILSCLCLLPYTVFRNLAYIRRKQYCRHAKVAPFWVFSASMGALAGKIRYRIKRQLW